MPLLAMMLLGLQRDESAAFRFGTPTVTPFAYGRKAAFSLEFDDSMVSQIANVLALLARYRFVATFYINPDGTTTSPPSGRRPFLAPVTN